MVRYTFSSSSDGQIEFSCTELLLFCTSDTYGSSPYIY